MGRNEISNWKYYNRNIIVTRRSGGRLRESYLYHDSCHDYNIKYYSNFVVNDDRY